MMDYEEDPAPLYHTLDKFEFVSGEVLENVTVEYFTHGTAKYNEKGEITNAIVYCHGSGGNYTSSLHLKDLVGEDDPFDDNENYIISLSALGTPNSLSPSSTELGNKFPHYSVEDMVNFQKLFLEDIGINHIKCLIGNSLGGFTALTWACKYPDFMDYVISMVSSYKTGGQNYVLTKIYDDILSSNKLEEKEAIKLASEATFPYGFSREFYMDLSNEQINESMNEYLDEEMECDLNDLKYRNAVGLDYNIENKLSNIKAKVLIIAINQDQYFPPELDAIPMSKLIENSKLIIFNSYLGHVGSKEIFKIKEEISGFLK